MLYYKMGAENFEQELVNTFRNTLKYRSLWVTTPVKATQQRFISICTTCMNRLEDLSKTLPDNLANNAEYSNAQFVLLDYNSQDGLKDWVRKHVMQHIESGRLVYYRTEEPSFFCPNHSRNMSFRLAQDGLVVNVDADNRTHKGFLRTINQCAEVASEHVLIVPSNFLQPDSVSLNLKGRFALYKKDIENLTGFDEDLDHGYGFDDLNFIFRAMMSRFKIVGFDGKFNEGRIHTAIQDRIRHMDVKDFRLGHIENVKITADKLFRKQLVVNPDSWGTGTVTRNFTERIELK